MISLKEEYKPGKHNRAPCRSGDPRDLVLSITRSYFIQKAACCRRIFVVGNRCVFPKAGIITWAKNTSSTAPFHDVFPFAPTWRVREESEERRPLRAGRIPWTCALIPGSVAGRVGMQMGLMQYASKAAGCLLAPWIYGIPVPGGITITIRMEIGTDVWSR